MMTETFRIMIYVCAVQDGSHEPRVAMEHLKCGCAPEKLNFKFYLILIEFK